MVAVVTTLVAVALAAAVLMVMVEARAMLIVVRLLAASSGGDGGDGTTTDVHDAILPWYTDIIDVRNDNYGNRAHPTPAINRGNIDGGVVDFANGMQSMYRGQQQWWGEGGNTGGGSSGRKRRCGGTSWGEQRLACFIRCT